uniref:Uncharacterized protein n=1 Tax=Trichobilharzia regenti TaxID=157069 RepID=A0AA85JIX2_TRIRE
MEAVETSRSVRTWCAVENEDKRQSVRSLFISALNEGSIESWEGLCYFLHSNSDFIQSAKDEAEFKYFVSRSFKTVKDILKSPSPNTPAHAILRLRSVFDSLCRSISWQLTYCTENTSVVCSDEHATVQFSPPWHSNADDFRYVSHGKHLAEEKVSNFGMAHSGLAVQEDNFLKEILTNKPFVISECQVRSEYAEMLLNIKSKNSPDEMEMIYPRDGFEAVIYFSVCRKLGIYEFMYFTRNSVKSWKLSHYNIKCVVRPQ